MIAPPKTPLVKPGLSDVGRSCTLLGSRGRVLTLCARSNFCLAFTGNHSGGGTLDRIVSYLINHWMLVSSMTCSSRIKSSATSLVVISTWKKVRLDFQKSLVSWFDAKRAPVAASSALKSPSTNSTMSSSQNHVDHHLS
jgi:hypothetical protein